MQIEDRPLDTDGQSWYTGIDSPLRVTIKRDNPCLFCRHFQPELPKPFAKHTIEALCVFLVLKRAHKVIRVSNQARFTRRV
jgi:hypothetical protein